MAEPQPDLPPARLSGDINAFRCDCLPLAQRAQRARMRAMSRASHPRLASLTLPCCCGRAATPRMAIALVGIALAGSTLVGCSLVGTTLVGIALAGSILAGSTLVDSILVGITLHMATLDSTGCRL